MASNVLLQKQIISLISQPVFILFKKKLVALLLKNAWLKPTKKVKHGINIHYRPIYFSTFSSIKFK